MSAMTIAITLVAGSSGGSAFTGMIQMATRLTGALGGLGHAGSKISPQIIGTGVAAGLAGAAFAGLFEVVKSGIDDAAQLQEELVRLQLASKLGSDAFDTLKMAVIDLGTHSLYSTTEAAQAFEKLSEMGFSASQTMYGMAAADGEVTAHSYDAAEALQGVGRQAMAVGEAMKTDAVTGATLLGSALHVFHDESLTAAQAANILVGTFYAGVPSAEGLQAAINNAGAMADSAGIKFHDFSTILGLLAQAGMPAEQAGTSLRYMIQSLIAPTNKQAAALAYLGIQVTNTTPAFKGLLAEMEKQGKAAATAAKGYDGSVKSLQAVFTAAQKAGDVPLDMTFNQWAEKNKLLNSSLFDSSGQFKGLGNAVEVLDKAMSDKSLSMQQKMDIISNLFNVRSGRAAQILTNLSSFKDAYSTEWDAIGKVNALQNAQKIMATFNGSITVLKTSLQSALADAFLPLIQAVTPLIQRFNDLVGVFLRMDPSAQGMAGKGLILLTVLVGIAAVVLTLVTVFATLAAIGVAVGTVLGTAGIIIAAVAGAIALIIGLVVAFKGALESNSAVMGVFNALTSAIGGLLNNLGQQFANLQKTMVLLEPVWNVLKIVFMAVAVIIGGILVGAFIAVIAIVIGVVWTINLIIQVLSAVFSAVGSFVGGLLGWFGELPGRIGNIWDNLIAGVIAAWNSITTGIQNFITLIRDTIQNGFGRVRDIIVGAITTVVGWFVWLYNHNYYFADLVNFIVDKFNQAKTFVIGVWTAISNFIQVAWAVIKMLVSSAVSSVTSTISTGFNNAKNTVQTIGLGIQTAVSQAWNVVVATVKDAISRFTSSIQNGTAPARNAATNIVNGIKNVIQGLISQMFNFGANAIHMLANGIGSAAGAVIQKAKDIAGQIAGILGFHSPPPEGPLADSDQYMPNMMKMYAKGIQDHTPVVSSALGTVATKIGSVMTPQIASNTGLGIQGQSGAVVIPINLDGKNVAQYMVDLQTKQVKQVGASRYAR